MPHVQICFVCIGTSGTKHSSNQVRDWAEKTAAAGCAFLRSVAIIYKHRAHRYGIEGKSVLWDHPQV
jgi:hypothetical protein